MRLLAVICAAIVLSGCAEKRVVTINTRPSDARISIDDVEKGQGSVTQEVVFKNDRDSHKVTASKPGYKDRVVVLTKDEKQKNIQIDLRPMTRVVNVVVQPVPAVVKINGKAISSEPMSAVTKELEFTIDEAGKWTSYTLSAEHAGFAPANVVVNWLDQPQAVYTLTLEPMKKDLNITTTPPGAEVFLDDEALGTSPVHDGGRAFPFDVAANQFSPRVLKAVKPGYDPVVRDISWDGGKTDYQIDFTAKHKPVRIITDPPGATVTIEGAELKRDGSGNSIASLEFAPINDKGELKTYTASIKKKTAESEWEPASLTIGWDGGRSDYSVPLVEIKTLPLPLLTLEMKRNDDGAWEALPKWITTIAARDVTEGKKPAPVRISPLMPKGTSIDSLAVSPDGKQVLFTVLQGKDKSDFRSQMHVLKTDGSGGAELLTDGRSLDVMPAYSPGGEQIVFSSNRAGRRLSIWSIATSGAPGITNLTNDEGFDLWPSLDSDPKPRLFYQAMFDTRPDPRLFANQVGTVFRQDLAPQGGTQPRVNPKNDAVIFSAVNEKTGKRDLWRMSDKGGLAQNLTNTPDVDEFDAAWNKDGSKIAFASDRAVDEKGRNNLDIWLMDLSLPQQPLQVTSNASQDDAPQWDTGGNSIYFRSNRGGEWGIWKVLVK
jgi:TolB protein